MKATLNGIVYDTDTAERLADVTHILDLFADGARQYVQSVYTYTVHTVANDALHSVCGYPK